MFAKVKDKTKAVSLRLRAKVTQPLKLLQWQIHKTISIANIPMADTHGVITASTEGMPSLYAAGKAVKPPKNTTAKKSLQFEDNQKRTNTFNADSTTSFGGCHCRNRIEIVEHDTATQTTETEEQSVDSTIVPENTSPSDTTDLPESHTDEPAAVAASTSTGTHRCFQMYKESPKCVPS